jgi:catechol 2,3-dioxygenase-like lactoylglutathione lyase family enzyme
MKLTHVDTIVLVENIEISRKFYTDRLGLEVLHDWQTMVVFKERFAIMQADRLEPQEETQAFLRPGLQGCGNVVIYFQSDNLEACYEQLKAAQVKIVHGILPLAWERIFRIQDPDGHVIEIGEPHHPSE